MIRILLCSYNGAAYIEAQLRSIFAQSCQDFEVLVSDDCSGDGTPELVERLARAYPGRLGLIRRGKPAGSACRHFLTLLADGSWKKPLAAFLPEGAVMQAGTTKAETGESRKKAAGLETAVGSKGAEEEKNGLFQAAGERQFQTPDYLMFADQDDVWDADKIARTRAAMRRAEERFGRGVPLLVHSDCRVTDADLRIISPSYFAYQQMSPERHAFHQLLVQNNVTGGAMMINRTLAELLGIMPAHAVMHDHWIALVAAAFGEVIPLHRALYSYRQHGDNVLGAARGSALREVLNRLGIGRRDGKGKAEMDAASGAVYRALFQQAESFMKIYGARLTPKKRRQLAAFICLQRRSRLGKAAGILCGGFTYNRLHRTLGEVLFM